MSVAGPYGGGVVYAQPQVAMQPQVVMQQAQPQQTIILDNGGGSVMYCGPISVIAGIVL